MENAELLESMELCGHFLYHRRGGRRGQNRILGMLYREGEMTQKEVQNRLDIQSGSISEIVRKLEAKGLVKRKKHKDDKRNVVLTITDEGKEFYNENQRIKKQQEAVIFNALSHDERRELKSLLDKLLADWEENFSDILKTHRNDENVHKINKMSREGNGND